MVFLLISGPFLFLLERTLKGQIWGKGSMTDLPCEVTGQYPDRKHGNADCPPTDYDQASYE
jgi:hypothetical protein